VAPTHRQRFLLQMAQRKNADAINNMQKTFLQTPCYESTNPSWEMRIRGNTVHLTIWIAGPKRDVVVDRGCRTLAAFKGAGFRSRRSIRFID